MKKVTFFLAVAGACLLASCAKTIEQPAAEESVAASKVVTYIQANGNEDAAKASIDNSAAFTWSKGDKIAVFVKDEYKFSDALAEGGSASASFAFSGENAVTDADRANFALFPASLARDAFGDPVSDPDDCKASNLLITLPGSYNLSDIKGEAAPVFMIAENAPNTALAFKQLGALLRFKLVNVPKQTQYITFDFNGKRVQGGFALTDVEAGSSAITTAATDDEDDIITVYNDGVFSTFQTSLIVNIPVPTGSYDKVIITTWDGEPGNGGHKINALKTPIDASTNWAPARKAAHRRVVTLPVYTISGNTIPGNGIKAVFAPGNLQAVIDTPPTSGGTVPSLGSAKSWNFAPNQYTAIGNTGANNLEDAQEDDVIDLFAWFGIGGAYWNTDRNENLKYGIMWAAGSGNGTYIGSTTAEAILADWGKNVISDEVGDYPAETWRLLTSTEWTRVIQQRKSSPSFKEINHGAKAMLTTSGGSPVAYGLILLPDVFEYPDGVPELVKTCITGNVTYTAPKGATCDENVYTLAQWAEMEAVGCVFLPLTNRREYSSSHNITNYPGDAWYWSSSNNGTNTGYAFAFNYVALGASSGLNASTNTYQAAKSLGRQLGAAVRLVRVVN